MTARSTHPAFRSDVIRVIALASGILSAIACWWARGSLWEDEIIAATHGLQPLPLFFVEVLRNDIHPFFYFFFLKLWSSLDFGSDAWQLASSLVGALVSAAVVGYIAFRVSGREAALWAATWLCLLPTFSWAASNLRMYAIMPAVATACWYANRQMLRIGGIRWGLALILAQLVQSYMHAVGFFFVPFFALAALAGQVHQMTMKRFLQWVGAQTVTLIGILPVVASALIRGTEPLPMPSLLSLLTYPAQTVAAGGPASWTLAAAGATFVVLLCFALLDNEGRILVLAVPCGALLACMLVSSLGKPMFKSPVFSANLTPFLAIGAAMGVSRHRATHWGALALACAVAMAVGLWTGEVGRETDQNYQPAGRFVASHAKPGDVVVAPSVGVFWGIARYAVGPRWGEPLAILPLHANAQWTALKAKLGPRWVALLGLTPTADHIDSQGVRYVIGTEIGPDASGCQRIWVVHRNLFEARGQEMIDFATPMHQESQEAFGDELTVSLLTPEACRR